MQLSAGVGGTDAADWTAMLERMYLRYAEASGLQAEVLDESPAEEAGLKSATIHFSGPFAYGKLQSEKGVHRLVRLSPFNSASLRQTSFALVDVIPEISQTEALIDEKDLKIDTYRSSGNGGQSVNTTDSAVRITHLPTGLVVAIQNERSQLKNKQRALSILASRLAELARQQHLESINELKVSSKSADWGSQIRSYVLHPYQKIKDNRSGYETSDTQGVLDGDLEPLIEAYLSSQVGKD
jgi:peptide chain release factor 2